MEVIIATKNSHKIHELQRIVSDIAVVLRPLATTPKEALSWEEIGATFLANAQIKARTVFQATGCACLADDSGLTVAELGGAPGVYSARYAGEQATDAQNMTKLIKELQGLGTPGPHLATFHCVLVFIDGLGIERAFSGQIDGHVITKPRGAHGFGYDPIFIPQGYTATFAELPSDVKDRVSHRARAGQQFRDYLGTMVGFCK